jgi:glycosyltransferase involved in cell wall biosynthesis
MHEKTKIVFNAVDYNITDKAYGRNPNLDNYVLQVGRIEPWKNQLAIIRALRKEKHLPIVFVGKVYPEFMKYYHQIKKIADRRGNVYFFDEIPHDEIFDFYRKASVHVLPSLRESPGLVSLEALSLGCKICVANEDFAPVNTYFQGIATIIDPMDIRSIHDGIMKEINTRRDMTNISKMVLNKFNWEVAARQTYNGYCSIMLEKK